MKVVRDCVGALNKWQVVNILSLEFFSLSKLNNKTEKYYLRHGYFMDYSPAGRGRIRLFLHISPQFPESRRRLVTARVSCSLGT